MLPAAAAGSTRSVCRSRSFIFRPSTIGFIGEAGSGKSVLIKGMFPGIELTNDDDGVNVRPLPLLEQEYETGFFTPHTYHLDIRFETGFHQLSELADAVRLAASASSSSILT